jgi:tetratricopeptide (TPR) repeat protein
MIDTLKGRHVWSNRYDRQYKDILKIQDEITLNIIKTIEAKYDKWLLASSSLLEHIGGTNSLDAYLLDEKASNLWVNLGPDNYQEIKRLLEEAISLDPNYLNPYNKLTWLYLREGRYGFSQYPQESPMKMH